MKSERRTCLIHHVDEDLTIIFLKVTYCVTLVLTQEGCPNQGREFMRGERAPDQTVLER